MARNPTAPRKTAKISSPNTSAAQIMALQSQLSKFKSEIADATSRNISHSRPSSTAPTRPTTKANQNAPPATEPSKRSHDTAFSQPASKHHGHELITQVLHAINYLKEKNTILPFEDLISYLSLPQDQLKKVELIKRALNTHERVEYIAKAQSPNGKECFRYRPKHPVTNAEELKLYLIRQPTAQGIPVKELKDGWPGCITAINELEKAGEVLVTRNKKDNVPIRVWTDSSTYHIPVDTDFIEFWSKTKLPASETEIRTELEKTGLTPTSQVKEVRRFDMKKKERKRPNRRGGKTTNHHMLSILKDYGRR